MPTEEGVNQEINIKIESSKGANTGVAHIHAVSKALARRKGLYIWAGSWGTAMLMLPIPVVHFLAVPLLLLLGPLVGFLVFKLNSGAADIVDGGAACPDCGTSIDLAGRDAHWPLDATCPRCDARLLINTLAQA